MDLLRLRLVACVTLYLAGVSYCLVDEAVIRTVSLKYFGRGLLMRQYSDGTDIIAAIFTSDNELLECHVEKSNWNATQALFSQSISNPDKNAQYLSQLDVAELSRKCQKYMEDIKRVPEEDLAVTEKRTRLRLDLDDLAAGTRYCSRQSVIGRDVERGSAVNHQTKVGLKAQSKMVGKGPSIRGNSNPLDECCRKWQQCFPSIPAMTEKNSLFNPYFWPMRSCDCEGELRICLAGVSESDNLEQRKNSLAFRAKYFGELQAKCFTVKQGRRCREFDLWHTKCLAHENQATFVLS